MVFFAFFLVNIVRILCPSLVIITMQSGYTQKVLYKINNEAQMRMEKVLKNHSEM